VRICTDILIAIILWSALFFIISCAQVGAPTGGARDTQPPVPVKSKPVNYSSNFKGNKIIIQFDEYIKLNNIIQELIITPVPDKDASVKLRGKNLIVKFNSKLEDSTTYSINFYNAIADLNENNPLPNFTFDFSTSSHFDSLYVTGNVKNAFNLNPEENIYIMLYEQMPDSAPRKNIAKHISKCDKNGNFIISNIRDKDYYLFALKDMNRNMLFDLPNESIAFSDSAFRASYELREVVDTFKVPSVISKNLQDTLYRDSLYRHMEWMTTVNDIELLFFTEDTRKQYLSTYERPNDKQIYFAFNREVTDSFKIVPLNIEPQGEWFKQEIFPKNDSIVYWLTDSNYYKTDSLQFELNYTMLDSNNEFYTQKDTVLLYFEIKSPIADDKKNKKDKPKKESKASKLLGDMFESLEKDDEDEVKKASELKIEGSESIELNTNYGIELNYPVSLIDTSLIQLFKVSDDTVLTIHKYSFNNDTTHLRRYLFNFKKDEDEKFKLLIPEGAFTDIYGNINDTIEFDLKTKTLKNYSVLNLDITNIEQPTVLQLLNEDESLRSELLLSPGDSSLNIDFLKPGKIKLKIFYDTNNNKIWDTGNFKAHRQPEKIMYFPAIIDLIGGVDYEYNWNLKK